MVIDKAFKKYIEKIPKLISWMVTFVFVNIAWILFRAESFADAAQMLQNLGSLSFRGLSGELLKQFRTSIMRYIGSNLGVFSMPFNSLYFPLLYFGIAMLLICFCKNAKETVETSKLGVLSSVMIAVLLTLCIISFSGISTFLYFNF